MRRRARAAATVSTRELVPALETPDKPRSPRTGVRKPGRDQRDQPDRRDQPEELALGPPTG